jgi:hypothetical protein
MDELYIKMCVAAQDILRPKWVPKHGDRVLTRWNSDENKIEIDYYSKDFITKEASVLLHHRTDVWLPRQEDLQQIIINGFKGEDKFYAPTPIMILKDFYKNHIPNKNDLNDKRNLNELWLCFVMETCYNKQWNGTTWTEIKGE